MYADEVHPHRTHQYTNLTMDVGAEKLQGPVHRLTRRRGREHRVRVPEPRLYPAAVRSSKRTNDRTQKEKQKPPPCTRNSQTTRFVFCLTRREQNRMQSLPKFPLFSCLALIIRPRKSFVVVTERASNRTKHRKRNALLERQIEKIKRFHPDEIDIDPCRILDTILAPVPAI